MQKIKEFYERHMTACRIAIVIATCLLFYFSQYLPISVYNFKF